MAVVRKRRNPRRRRTLPREIPAEFAVIDPRDEVAVLELRQTETYAARADVRIEVRQTR